MNQEATIINRLKDRLDEKRYQHALGVAETATKLAKRYNYNREKAYLAGLLHDYAKNLKEEELIQTALKSEFAIDELEYSLPQLLHAPAAAYLVQKDFNINDRDIVEAIRYHTIGHPDMGILAQIIYIADYIEPNRDYPQVQAARKASLNSLRDGILSVTASVIKFNIDRGRIIHPYTILLRNAFLRRK